jgi:hypothetical protein
MTFPIGMIELLNAYQYILKALMLVTITMSLPKLNSEQKSESDLAPLKLRKASTT